MLDRSTIREGRYYWVRKRKGEKPPTIAFTHGELPSLSIRVLDDTYTPICSEYDFLAEVDLSMLFEKQFQGTTVEELVRIPVHRSLI